MKGAIVVILSLAVAATAFDFGVLVEKKMKRMSPVLFGFKRPLSRSASEVDYVPRQDASASERVLVAAGLKVEFVTRKTAKHADMMAFWPDEFSYTHLIFCIEAGRSANGTNSAVQTIDVATGDVRTILYGMDRCDGIRTTDWGTILATEETDDGAAYEIIDPLGFDGHWIADRTLGSIMTSVGGTEKSKNVAKRDSMMVMAWEGLAVAPSGVTYGGDELRPGSGGLDSDGGAMYKFVPKKPRTGNKKIKSLTKSPLVDGDVFALSVSCTTGSSFPQYGQGCETGVAAWVLVDQTEYDLRVDANNKGATGFYRPEDLHSDPKYEGEGIRFCWTNTGSESAQNYAEVMCAIDTDMTGSELVTDGRNGFKYLARDGAKTMAVVNRFIEGDTDFNSFDNLAFNNFDGNLAVVEDHPYGDIFSCLPDGADRDDITDGCAKFLSVVDPEAEPTGFTFDGTGKVAYLSIQHGECPDELKDFESNRDDGCTDDILKVSGFYS